MNQTISHAGDLLPFNLGQLFTCFQWNPLGSLSNDLKAPHKGPLLHLVTDKGVKACLTYLCCQKLGFQKNIAQKFKR